MNIDLKPLGFINFLFFQWFFTRLAYCTNEKGEFVKFKFIFAWPLTKWIWK